MSAPPGWTTPRRRRGTGSWATSPSRQRSTWRRRSPTRRGRRAAAGGVGEVAPGRASGARPAGGLRGRARGWRRRPGPRRRGGITGPGGAASRDIISVATRRWPVAELLVIPTRVQGDGAEAEICGALALLTRVARLDVAIIGRCGGAPEDLWTFNHERACRARAAGPVPVSSSVR